MTTLSPAPKQGRLRRWVLLAIALLALIGAGAGIARYLGKQPEQPPAPPDVPSPESEEMVIRAVRAARERVLREPNSVHAWGTLGMVFIANDMEDECLVCFAQAERMDPENPRWPYYRGGVYINKGEPAVALPYLQRAVALCERKDPKNQVPRLFLAETLLSLGQVEEAAEELHRAFRQAPEDARVHFDLGLVDSFRGHWREGADHFRRCLNDRQTQKKATIKLAEVYRRLGKQDEADRLRQQVEVLPNDSDWNDPYVGEYLEWAQKKKNRYRLSEQLDQANHLAEAAEVLRPMVEQYPEDYLPALTLAKIVGRMGDFQMAERLMRRCLELAPDKVQAHYYLSLILLLKGEQLHQQRDESRQAEKVLAEAVSESRKALAGKADYSLAFMTLGRSLKLLGKPEEALQSLRQAVQCSPEYGELHYHLGKMLAERGQKEEARRQLEQALELTSEAGWREDARKWLGKLAPKGGGKRPTRSSG